MHGQEMIHGDLKGVRPIPCDNPGSPYPPSPCIKANILIDHNGHAQLADFGLLTIISDPAYTTMTFSSHISGGTVRWMSPELLAPEQSGRQDSRPTKFSDCYALGMVIYEVLSGRVPFDQLRDTIVMRRVPEGLRPERPQGEEGAWFTDWLWVMVERCWIARPDDRPSVDAVLEYLRPRADGG